MTKIRLYNGMGFDGEYRFIESVHLKNRDMYSVRLQGERELSLNGSEVRAMINRERVFGIIDVAPASKNGGKKR